VQALGTGGYHSFFQLTLPVDEHLAIFAAGLRILLARRGPRTTSPIISGRNLD
jgi:hypothetical protein